VDAGRKAEFERLLRPQVDALYRTALRMTGQDAAAQDLLQEASLNAWRGFGNFEAGSNFRAWIFRILTNAFINRYRKEGRAPTATDFADVEPAAPEETPTLSAEDVDRLADQLGDEAAKALSHVPPEFRVVFLLSTFEDMSYKEIASVLEIPVGTVMSRLFRARSILREELAAYAARSGQR
jgi:RNA polymerase sigma-70 factor (ECF subfamily)